MRNGNSPQRDSDQPVLDEGGYKAGAAAGVNLIVLFSLSSGQVSVNILGCSLLTRAHLRARTPRYLVTNYSG